MSKDDGIGSKTYELVISIVKQRWRIGATIVPALQDIGHHLLISHLHQIADECWVVVYGLGAHLDSLVHVWIVLCMVVIVKASDVVGVSIGDSLAHILYDGIETFIDVGHTLAPAPVTYCAVVVTPCLLVLRVLVYLGFPQALLRLIPLGTVVYFHRCLYLLGNSLFSLRLRCISHRCQPYHCHEAKGECVFCLHLMICV